MSLAVSQVCGDFVAAHLDRWLRSVALKLQLPGSAAKRRELSAASVRRLDWPRLYWTCFPRSYECGSRNQDRAFDFRTRSNDRCQKTRAYRLQMRRTSFRYIAPKRDPRLERWETVRELPQWSAWLLTGAPRENLGPSRILGDRRDSFD